MFDSTRRAAEGGAILYAKAETALGVTVVSVPFWATALHSALSWFTLVCGAVIGAHGAWRIVAYHWRRWRGA